MTRLNDEDKDKKGKSFLLSDVDVRDYGIFYLHGPIDEESTSDLIEYIIATNIVCPKHIDSIKLIINSPGGDMSSCFAVIDAMQSSGLPVVTYGTGMVASSALMIFIAGHKGMRYLSPTCVLLSHQFSMYLFGDAGAKEHELKAEQKIVDINSKLILEHYIKCTGLKEASIKKNLLPPHDVYLTPTEAKKYKLCDHVANLSFVSSGPEEPGETEE